jgi:hypothetical protein
MQGLPPLKRPEIRPFSFSSNLLHIQPLSAEADSLRDKGTEGHRAAQPQPNPKHEIRKSKQIKMTKIPMI